MMFLNNWCDIVKGDDEYIVQINATRKDIEDVESTSVKNASEELVQECLKIVGNNPVICLSGGIDSQAMINVWLQCDVKFTPLFFKFSNDLNKSEFNDAVRFAKQKNLNLKIIELDVLRFLQRENLEYASNYKISSPQFSTHAKFLELARNEGYSGAVLAGNGLLIEESRVRFKYSYSQVFDIENYSKYSGFPIVSNFLAYSKSFCIKLALHSEKMPNLDIDIDIKKFGEIKKQSSQGIRYQNKIQNYKNMNFEIIPQEFKKTGFEEIKQFYNEMHGSFYAFDNSFRMPMYNINKPVNIDCRILDCQFENYLLQRINSKSF